MFKRKYKIIEALKDVSFEINEGEIVGYIGPNGAGKSTTIKIMSGIIAPTSGTCEINGFNPFKDRMKYVKSIGAVFGQRSNLAWDVPVIDSYELIRDIYKVPKDEYKRTLNNLIEKLDLKEIIYFCLHWAFVAVHGLSLVAASGLLIAVASLVGHGLGMRAQ